MADDRPASVSVKLYNNGRGARTFENANREPQILRAGADYEGDILEADKEALQDLADAYEARASGTGAVDPSSNEHSVTDFPSLDGLDRNGLLAVAEREGYSLMAADASEDEIRDAINAARERTKDYQADLVKLAKTSRAKLLETAKKESVSVETDDNQGQLAQKIADARRANAEAK